MSSRIGAFAMFSAGNRFVSLKLSFDCLDEISEEVLGSHVSITNGKVYWHRPGNHTLRIFSGCQEDPDFGLCPEGPEEACVDTDAYFASCVTQDEWLAGAPDETQLLLFWWSATENVFAPDGHRIAFGPVITSH